MVPASLGKTASETNPLVFNLPIVLLHVVEPDREVQLGRDQPSDGRRQVEFRKSRIVLRGNELRLGLQQRLVLDQNVQHGAGADQRLLLGPFERDLSRSHSRRKGRNAGPRRLQSRPELRRRLNCRPARVIDLAAPLPDRLLGLPRLRIDSPTFLERHRQLRGDLGRVEQSALEGR